ncbi:D-2-hydroxyacid dehydrogenase family protein [Thermoactinomyces sp. DSM 45891]|uniref:D-2-hydroxyacid dehydrogenase family protein n=1 Tax=Thermoactinomyces sp. DSM 45891 TaxID=1761907 RepID=UPI00093037C5|nr:D-2-hydroxyacid dehydrogenase family protein [Thermoactinomyces sp. DSM 45891]
MKWKCVILDDYQNVAMKITDWSAIADKVEVTSIHHYIENEDELVNTIQDYEIVVIMRERTPFPARLFKRLEKLKLLITSGMRNASIDLQAASSNGVTVCGTASSSEPPTELAWALILGLARNIVVENNALKQSGPWQQTVGTDLYGKTLGLLGLGKIGGRMARIGKAFGMNVIAWSQNLTREQAENTGVALAASKEELLKNSDFVSIHLVLSDRTRGLIGEEELQLMRPSSFLINTSRAAIVDQVALMKALESKQIAGAGVDVFEIEPLPELDPLRTLPNLLATPHLGYVTQRNYHTYYKEAVEDIIAFVNGSPIRTLV